MTQSDQSEHFSHISVLLKESIEGLHIKPDGIYVDCTLGGGGHARRIAQALTNGGRLIAIVMPMPFVLPIKRLPTMRTESPMRIAIMPASMKY